MRTVYRLLIVLILAVAVPAGIWAQCVTDDLTPEQKACCQTMGHNCGTSGVQMGCCPTEPQTQEWGQAPGVKPDASAPLVLRGPLSLLPEPHVRVPAAAAVSFDLATLKLSERPPYLVLSVFLI